MIDVSMLPEFITEAREHLEEMENDLLELENTPENREVLNDIFRAAHTIKGSSEYMGMVKIAELSHRLENLLDLLRNGEMSPRKPVIDTLMAARDRIAVMTDELEKFQSERSDIDDLLAQIATLIEGAKEEPQTTEESAGEEPLEPSPTILSALAPDVCDGQPKPEARPPLLPEFDDTEVYDEETDEELFEIFTQQLTENFARIQAAAPRLSASIDGAAAAAEIAQHVKALRSSANYMGYDQLTQIYVHWLNAIERFQDDVLAGAAPSAAFMEPFIQSMSERFPELRHLKADPPPREQDPALTDTPSGNLAADAFSEAGQNGAEEREDIGQWTPGFSVGDREAEIEQLIAGLIGRDPAALQDAAETEPAAEGAEVVALPQFDSDLFSKLSSAFDHSMVQVRPMPALPAPGEMETELFSSISSTGDGLSLAPDNPADTPAGAATDRTSDGGFSQSRTAANIRNFLNPREKEEETQENGKVFSGPGVEKLRERRVKQSLRVDAGKIDSLMNQVGELVVSRAWFSQLFNEMKTLKQFLKEEAGLSQKEMKQVRNLTYRLGEATVALGRVANELQEGVMRVRMLPISQLFNRYPRLVRDLVRDAGKQVRLELKGEDTELDKMIIEEIGDPLVHLIRNAVDHGIETTEERKRIGKPAVATLLLEAYHESNHVVIEVVDDGRGIDTDLIKAVAARKGLMSMEDLDRMGTRELTALILRPGFSTASEITHTSGRGVGMDVVKKNVENLNGTLEVDSVRGEETRFRIKIPLTLAVIPALLVKVGQDLFTIPLSTVEETLRIYEKDALTIEGIEVINLRNSTLPLVRLTDIFQITPAQSTDDKAFVVVVSAGERRVGLVVDRLIGQEEVVIKPLVDYLQENSGFSGATILGDGSISLILDVYELINISMKKRSRTRMAAAV